MLTQPTHGLFLGNTPVSTAAGSYDLAATSTKLPERFRDELALCVDESQEFSRWIVRSHCYRYLPGNRRSERTERKR